MCRLFQDQLGEESSSTTNDDRFPGSLPSSKGNLERLRRTLLQAKRRKYLVEGGDDGKNLKSFAVIPCDDSYFYEALWFTNLSNEGTYVKSF